MKIENLKVLLCLVVTLFCMWTIPVISAPLNRMAVGDEIGSIDFTKSFPDCIGCFTWGKNCNFDGKYRYLLWTHYWELSDEGSKLELEVPKDATMVKLTIAPRDGREVRIKLKINDYPIMYPIITERTTIPIMDNLLKKDPNEITVSVSESPPSPPPSYYSVLILESVKVYR